MDILCFTLEKCPPAKLIEDCVEEIVSELSVDIRKKINFVKITADEKPDLAGKFLINAVPAVIVIKGNNEAGRIVGFYPREEIKTKLKTFLS